MHVKIFNKILSQQEEQMTDKANKLKHKKHDRQVCDERETHNHNMQRMAKKKPGSEGSP